jgi:hypothetical protein
MVKLRWSGFVVVFSVIIGLAFSSCATAGTLPGTFRVIPQPRQVELFDGVGLEFGGLKAVLLKGDFPRPVMGPKLSYLPETGRDGVGVLSLELAASGSSVDSPEGYVLVISGGKVKITSRGQAGLFYGCQTLEQLLEDARDTGTAIPACKITDYPALSYRAVHFDVKHHLDTMKYYYDSIDRLARYKINAIIFEFEDKLRYQRQPLVGAPQAISIDEMAALTNYARRRHIEISPLVQGLGHATFILKHQKYAYLRENPNEDSPYAPRTWAFCPLHEDTYQVLFDLYRDAFDATPGARYLHVGGDEVGEIGKCSRCKPTAEKEGVFGLNLYWLNRVCEFAQEQGRTPIFWDDMPLKYAELWRSAYHGENPEKTAEIWEKGVPVLDDMIERFPRNCVYMRWNYTRARHPGSTRILDWYRDRGLKAMIATAAQNTTVLMPQDDRVDIIQSFVSLAAERGIEGMLCTAWDDASPHMETYWRGLIASAEFSWSPTGRSLEDYEIAYLHREFGPECTDVAKRQTLFAKSLKDLKDIPDLASPGTWSQKHKDRLALAEKEVEHYGKLAQQFAELSKKARRNRYRLEVLSAINDLQVTGAHLVLALKKCDVADKAKQKEGMKSVREVLKEFDRAWANLQAVYAKTRFIAYPENYVRDRYFHIASQREDLSWMIQTEEEYHKLVRDWLEANDG